MLVLIGLVASSYRRYVLAPAGLQRTWDATIVVSLIAGLMVTFLLAEAGGYAKESLAEASGQEPAGWSQTWLPAGTVTAKLWLALGISKQALVSVGIVSWWIHLLILLFFLVYLPYSKHMHLLWSPFAVFFGELPGQKGVLGPARRRRAPPHPRLPSGRSRGGSCSTPTPAPNADGASGPALRWRVARSCRLGRSFTTSRTTYCTRGYLWDAVQPRVAADGRELIGGIVEPEALWACSSCYACMDKCPVRNEHVPLIVEMRRKLVEQGKLDATLQETLMSLQRYGNSQGKSPRKRFEWAGDLPQPIKDAAKEPVETLWFLGDYAAYHPSSVRASRMVAQVFQQMGLDFGCLLKDERSAGNDVRRAGEEGLFEMLAEQNMKALEKAQFQRIVTTDPHTYHTLKHEYRRFGLSKPVYHYSEILDEAFRTGA